MTHQCQECESTDVTIEAGTANCKQCGVSSVLSPWDDCPDCGGRMRTTHSLSGVSHAGNAVRTSRRVCQSPGCKYKQTSVATVVCERPQRGQGYQMQMKKLVEGSATVTVEKKRGPTPGMENGPR